MAIQIDGREAVTMKQLAEALNTSVNALAARKSRGRVRLTHIGTIGGEHLYAKTDIDRLKAAW